ncbi:DUF5610 domain-containing protein [Aeromonas diversa]|uniref:DUF5610 domain-containing protein n=1 Tax=Aeromonas diversa TaxID=502790 RepID=UPI0039A3A4B6
MQIDGVAKTLAQGSDLAHKAKAQAATGETQSQDRTDQVSLHGRPKWAQVLVQQALQFSLELNGAKYQAPKQTEEVTPDTLFDFEEVSKNVLSFVTGRMGMARADGKDDDSLTKMMEQARKGVDMGFAEAKKMLGDYATDNEDIKTGIDQSYKLIQEGLDQFEKEFFGDISPTEMASIEMASRQQGSLEIQTKDGDKVVLRFNDSWQFKHDQGDKGSKVSFQNSQSFSFSLQGDLSDEEMGAIGKLIKGIDELGQSFFSGNLDELMGKVGDLQLDDSQLVGFSLKLKQHSKMSAAYQGNTLQDALKPLADYLPKLTDWQQQADQQLPPDSQQQLTQSVLGAQGHDVAEQERFTGFNQRLLDALRLLG